MNLFINWYESPAKSRLDELAYCTHVNEGNPLIGKIYKLDGRPTFKEFFDYVNTHCDEKDINIISNTDIYFDESLRLARGITPDECFALSRWDLIGDGKVKHFNRWDSQDCWIFRGKIKEVKNCDFTMGVPGCDNAIADRLAKAGYVVINPSLDIKTYHLHLSRIFTYNSGTKRIPEPYKMVTPCKL
jgi:hypothetical protein